MAAFISSFSEQFRADNTPFLSPQRVCDAFGFQVQELADLAHVHRNTIQARPQSATLQKHLQDLLAVLQLATDMTEDLPRAIFLLRNEPLRVFDGKTAVDLVKAGRTEELKGYLRSIEGGAAG